MAWGFSRFKLLDILPVAKSEIFRGLDDMILVIDEKERILDMNPAAESMFKIKAPQNIGQEASKVFNHHPQFKNVFCRLGSSEVCLNQGESEHVYDLRVSYLTDSKSARIGKVIALRDITDRKREENALLESKRRLRNQNSVIMSLSKIKLDEIGELNTVLKRITRDAAQTLKVERVSVWLYNRDESKFKCIELYEHSTKLHCAEMELFSTDYPRYFEIIREERTIARMMSNPIPV